VRGSNTVNMATAGAESEPSAHVKEACKSCSKPDGGRARVTRERQFHTADGGESLEFSWALRFRANRRCCARSPGSRSPPRGAVDYSATR